MHKTALKKILLFPFVLLVWFPLWFLLMGTLTGSEELAATIGPTVCDELGPTITGPMMSNRSIGSSPFGLGRR